ncbi:hypothetical protein DHEL01_v212245 [Diaporthe helianthi]|uniref:MHYT domain-containing protein n=1 Tax=Diaporthe helianthi TaxID=158607 RepID=A0A2P5HGI5_DIAHE|nr:hypothetical protein DHEL01_v212245 [Diaporthe helianthi]
MSLNQTEAEQLFEKWGEKIVPRSFNAGFVTLSYVVSLIGAASTLELINRRTAPKGKINHLLLVSAAVTMGGIAIWCMHFIGNRAIEMAGGEPSLQIAYSSGFTAFSFFMPILVLVAAFVAIGTNDKVSWWRVTIGGTLAGAAICGMHYLGNASINNYVCIYNIANVVGAALIAVAASIIALSLFFVFRAGWTSSWWKRIISAVLLAGAVSGMHWCASTGTSYKLIALAGDNNQLSRNETVIVVICLSVGACLVMASFAMYTARIMQRYASKAQQVVLAAAVFDKHGRVLVSPDGLLPSEKITDSFLEKTPQDSFTVAHPLFHWMFQASRNWSSINTIINGISNHLSHLPHNGRDNSRGGIKLITDHGELIEKYDVIFRELFCAAAAALAEKMKTQLTSVGILWDEILPTGAGGRAQTQAHQNQQVPEQVTGGEGHGHGGQRGADGTHGTSLEDLAEKGVIRQPYQEFGRGSLMFLVRRVENTRDMESLAAAGYRFAELHQVSGIIGSTMQIKTRSIENKLRTMSTFAEKNAMLEPGVHVGFFGVRARVNNAYGFDVLARRNARNLLPSVQMPLARLDAWQMNFIRQLERMTPHHIARRLAGLKNMSHKEMMFASQLADSIESLRGWVEDSIFDEAVLCSKTVEVPCRPVSAGSSPGSCTVISFRIVVPIHLNVDSPKCEFVPLNMFKVHQLVYKDSPNHLAFTRSVHRELAPIINAVPVPVPAGAGAGAVAAMRPSRANGAATSHSRRASLRDARMSSRLFRSGRPQTSGSERGGAVDGDGVPIPTTLHRASSWGGASGKSSSTLKLWDGRPSNGGETSPGAGSVDSASDAVLHGLAPPAYAMEELHSPTSPPPPPSPSPARHAMSGPPQQASSFGGIMVSQEITVNVQRAGEVNEGSGGSQYSGQGRQSFSRAGSSLLLRRASENGGHAEEGANVIVGMGMGMGGGSRGGPGTGSGSGSGSGTGLGEARSHRGIEMRPMGGHGNDRSSVHIGSGVQVSNVEAEMLTDAPTFVDELFGFCVEGR